MKLNTTDFEILNALADGKRNNAVNLAHELDKNRAYINTRLPILADYDLLKRIGPAPNSGLYKITEKGQAVVAHQDAYYTDDTDFDTLIENSIQQTADMGS